MTYPVFMLPTLSRATFRGHIFPPLVCLSVRVIIDSIQLFIDQKSYGLSTFTANEIKVNINIYVTYSHT